MDLLVGRLRPCGDSGSYRGHDGSFDYDDDNHNGYYDHVDHGTHLLA